MQDGDRERAYRDFMAKEDRWVDLVASGASGRAVGAACRAMDIAARKWAAMDDDSGSPRGAENARIA